MQPLVRYALPAVILVVGVVLVVAGNEFAAGAGIVLIGVAALVVLFNLFAQLSIASQGDREKEDAAREQFSRTGRWPAGDPADAPPRRPKGRREDRPAG